MFDILKTIIQFIPSHFEAKNYPIIGFVESIHRVYLKILSNTAIRWPISLITARRFPAQKLKEITSLLVPHSKPKKEAMKKSHNHIFI
jgi:hypothetical protein